MVKTRVLMKEMDERLTKFFEVTMEYVAEMYMEQILKRIPQEDQYKEYRDSFRAFVSTKMNKVEKFSQVDIEKVKTKEVYWSGVEAVGNVKGFNQLWLERTLVKVKKQRNVTLPFKDLLLFRHQPWTLDTIPALPASDHVYFVYEDIGLNDFYKQRVQSRKNQAIVRQKLTDRGYGYENEDQIINEFKAISNLYDIALRLEFGVMTQKRGHWIPAKDYVSRVGLKTILKNQRILEDIIHKVSYKGFKKRRPKLDDIPENRVDSFKDFVERIL